MTHPLITLVHGDGARKPVRCSEGFFRRYCEDVPTGNVWNVQVDRSGYIQCHPTKNGVDCPGLQASAILFAPHAVMVPGPEEKCLVIDRRPIRVADIGCRSMHLQKGFAVTLHFGCSHLIVSWEFPEFEHPKVE